MVLADELFTVFSDRVFFEPLLECDLDPLRLEAEVADREPRAESLVEPRAESGRD